MPLFNTASYCLIISCSLSPSCCSDCKLTPPTGPPDVISSCPTSTCGAGSCNTSPCSGCTLTPPIAGVGASSAEDELISSCRTGFFGSSCCVSAGFSGCLLHESLPSASIVSATANGTSNFSPRVVITRTSFETFASFSSSILFAITDGSICLFDDVHS